MIYPHSEPYWDRIPNDPRPHAVYELWLDGECQYVGMTCNVERRLQEHRKIRGWLKWDEVRTTTLSSRGSAGGLETRLIAILRPKHNRRWNPAYDKSLRHRSKFRMLIEASYP